MMTLTGNYITRELGAPSVEDIALGLSRMPRFAGQTLFEWTVADHLVVCARYLRWLIARGLYTKHNSPMIELYVLMHDAHEAMTGDIPTSFKTDDMRALQKRLDVRLYASLGLCPPSQVDVDLIKQIDRHMLIAEAKVCTPQTTYEKILFERGETVAWPGAVDVIEEYLHEDRDPEAAFLALTNELLSAAECAI